MEYVPIWERDAQKRGEEIGEKRGVEIGEKRGMEKGMKKKAKETVKNLLKMGIDIDKISKATGMKKEEIEKLASKSQ
jgi:predicted transposase/invertase (TIGR01784 family)